MLKFGVITLGVFALFALTPAHAEGCADLEQINVALESAEGLSMEDKERATILRDEAAAMCQVGQDEDATVRIEEAKGLLGLT